MKRGAGDEGESVIEKEIGSEETKSSMPQKKYFRSRAHCNPLSNNDGFEYPLRPVEMDWSPYYPGLEKPVVNFVDVGCGYGGLSIALASLYPDKVTLGMEIRPKVCEFVKLRAEALREECPGSYENVSSCRTNCMRYLPNYFEKGQFDKMFFCFPDPHFKAKNHRRRIISDTLLTEYAYFLKPNARLYTITDVKDLHEWHVSKCDEHPLFVRLDDKDVLENDPAVKAMIEETEEGKKVARSGGEKFYAVYRKKTEEEMPQATIFSVL
jgi:tRNA (guanine-N7-)-methyltransferase